MSLRIKSLLVAMVTMVVLLIIFLVFTRLIVTSSYTQLEQADTAEHVARAANALRNELNTLARTANDYAAWDDSYNFMESHDPAYLDANYPETTFANNRLSLATIVDPHGEVVFARAFDLDQELETPVAPEILDAITHDPALLRPAQSITSTVGVLNLSTGPLLVAAQPILTNDGSGPSRGALLMGRALSAAEVQRLSEVTQLALTVLRPNDDPSPETQAAVGALSAQTPIVVQPVTELLVQGYTWVNDINGHPTLLLRVDRARGIYQQGQTTLSYLIVVLVIGGLTISMVLAGLLQYTVIRRLGRLNDEVRAIGASSDFSQRVSPQGRDELGQLAAEVNHMLDSLESTESELSQREREAITLLDSIPAYAFLKDAAGRYVMANQKFCDALHHTREEVAGKTDYNFYSPERAERYRADDLSVTLQGQTREVSEETIGEGPDAVVLATRKVPLFNEHGQVIGLIGLAFDITDRIRAAQELAEARDEALAAVRFKSQLLSNVSHDLRTPIGAIMGFAEMLEAGVYGPLQERQVNPVTRIILNSQQLGRMVSDLLDQSRLDAGKLVLRFRPFSPNDLVASIKAAGTLNAREKDLALVGLVDADVPETIVGDYERVHQVVLNLVDNAIRFTDEGTVMVHLRRWDTTQYVIVVSDTGRGIALEDQARVFEAFQQAGEPTTGRYKGLGLGLSIVKQLVTLMGGEVTLDSTPGMGTTFTIALPVTHATEA
jgi:PAS domain S-box-containing protein